MSFNDFLKKLEERNLEANIIHIKRIDFPIEKEVATETGVAMRTTFSKRIIVYAFNLPYWNKFTDSELNSILNIFKILDGKELKVKELVAKRKGEDNIEFEIKLETEKEKSVVELVSKVL
jgi:hypothetical protein